MGADRELEGIGRHDVLVVDLGDDVALLQARLVGRAVTLDAADVGALAHRELRALGVLGVDRGQRGTQVGVGDLLARDDGLGDLDRVVAVDGKAHSRTRARAALDDRVDADELALVVHQRATRVAGVDGRVGLNQVGVDRAARVRRQHRRAVQRADNACRDGLVEAVGASDRHDPVANHELGGVANLDRGDLGVPKVDVDHGEVARAVGAQDRAVVALAVDGDRDGLGAVDDVVVGEDVAVLVQDDARADAGALVGGHADRDDRRQRLLGHGLRDRGVGVGCVDGDLLVGGVGGVGAGQLHDTAVPQAGGDRRGADDAAGKARDRRLQATVAPLGLAALLDHGIRAHVRNRARGRGCVRTPIVRRLRADLGHHAHERLLPVAFDVAGDGRAIDVVCHLSFHLSPRIGAGARSYFSTGSLYPPATSPNTKSEASVPHDRLA